MNPGLKDLIIQIRELGFKIKLDTNGFHPEVLKELLSAGLLDYVAMDIKAGRGNYSAVTGTLRPGLDAVEESVALLRQSGTAHEFRTTVVRELHSDEDFIDIAAWLAGEERYFLQCFKDSGDIIGMDYTACSEEEMKHFLAIVRETIPDAQIRGMD